MAHVATAAAADMSFGVWDVVVLVAMLLISAGIGLYYRFTGGKQKTNAEYFLADRNTPVFTVAVSLMASFMSAITLMGVSMENYQYGAIFVVINLGYGIVTPVAAYLYLPVFWNLQTTSAYEYLEMRFGQSTRLAASISYSLQMTLYMGIVLFAPALALKALTGIEQWAAILMIGVVCTFYSTIGGMKAVLITDLFQSALMFVAIYCVIIGAMWRAGGVAPIWQRALEGGRLYFDDFDPDPTKRHTWWTLIIGGGFTYLSLYAVNQTQVQRLMTVGSLRQAQAALWWSWPVLTALSLSTSFSGLAMYYLYADCDPKLQGHISSRDQLLPRFVIDVMGEWSGVPGLFVSGIFAASLSTVSALVNSLAAITLEDYLKPLWRYWRKREFNESGSALPSKVLAFSYGVVCIAVAFLAQNMGGVLQASLTVFGVVGGPLFALFTLGMVAPSVRQRGALVGLACGLCLGATIGFGGPKPAVPELPMSLADCTPFGGTANASLAHILLEPDTVTSFPWLFRISYMWIGVLSALCTFGVGWLTSGVLTAVGWGGEHLIYLDGKRMYVNADLFVPPLARRLKARNARRMEQDADYVNTSDVKLNNTQL